MERKYKVGLLLILTVETLGITSEEILQGILKGYNHPFIVTYIQISLLVFYLLVAFVSARLQKSTKQFFGRRSAETSSSSSESHEADDDYSDLEQSMIGRDDNLSQDRKLTSFGVAKLALIIAPFWFISQYLNNAALARTSVTSAIRLLSTSSAFTLWIGKLVNKESSVNWVNIVSVIVSLTGVSLTTLGHTWKAGHEPTSTSIFKKGGHTILGDILALLSAMAEAAFTVLLKRYAKEGDGLDMRVLYGYIGLFTISSLSWLVWPLVALGLEPKFELPGIHEMKGIICSGLVGTFFSDYACYGSRSYLDNTVSGYNWLLSNHTHRYAGGYGPSQTALFPTLCFRLPFGNSRIWTCQCPKILFNNNALRLFKFTSS
ncbi:uncharacterized vacuolar membrane protein YML018C-like [Neltuma alba]|uniref:uncharacterized vacuolar membrane protein YML018C-like n=1 Tax=Neltuma alba TaxID=207710 RepID=UPI0010A3C272|nr:uncharacterized vacuolar membrane protein YML018C-like [Prosopis alba]